MSISRSWILVADELYFVNYTSYINFVNYYAIFIGIAGPRSQPVEYVVLDRVISQWG